MYNVLHTKAFVKLEDFHVHSKIEEAVMTQTTRQRTIDLSMLPENAQEELYDFFLFLQKKYPLKPHTQSSGHTKDLSAKDIFPRLVKPFNPLSREEIYE